MRRRVGAAPPARAAAVQLVVLHLISLLGDDVMAGRQFQMLPESTIGRRARRVVCPGGVVPVRCSRRARPPAFDPQDYKGRNVVEWGFNTIKQWRDWPPAVTDSPPSIGGAVLRAITVCSRG